MMTKQLGQQEAADQLIINHLNVRSKEASGDWYEKIAQFLLGNLNENDFFNAADIHNDPKKRNGQKCEAYFYAANKSLLTGDFGKAIILLKQCIETGYRDFYEFKGAKIQLQVLNDIYPSNTF